MSPQASLTPIFEALTNSLSFPWEPSATASDRACALNLSLLFATQRRLILHGSHAFNMYLPPFLQIETEEVDLISENPAVDAAELAQWLGSTMVMW